MKWTAALILAAASYVSTTASASPLPVPTYVPPIAPVYGAEEVEAPPAPPLVFTSAFPSALSAGSKLELAWEGGDGRGVVSLPSLRDSLFYSDDTQEVYFIPRWARQREYEVSLLFAA